jgi:hypothetical protein
MERRLRKEKHHLRAFTIGMYNFNNINNNAIVSILEAQQTYKWSNRKWTEKDLEKLEDDLVIAMYDSLKNTYEQRLNRNTVTMFDVEEVFDAQYEVSALYVLLIDLLNTWHQIYKPTILRKNDLAELAGDSQNVHTSVVNNQTRISMEMIISAPVKKNQKTFDEILTSWVVDLHIGSEMSPVYKDMLYWANKDMIIKEDDYLYRRVLRGLWAKIKSYEAEVRYELTKRLWEECNESVGMCAQGHLSRLANVLVGFDKDFKPELSVKEILQDSLSKIAAGDEPNAVKVEKAIAVMDQLSLPNDERQAWLDAF